MPTVSYQKPSLWINKSQFSLWNWDAELIFCPGRNFGCKCAFWTFTTMPVQKTYFKCSTSTQCNQSLKSHSKKNIRMHLLSESYSNFSLFYRKFKYFSPAPLLYFPLQTIYYQLTEIEYHWITEFSSPRRSYKFFKRNAKKSYQCSYC